MLDIEQIDRKLLKSIKKTYSKVSALVMTSSPSDKNTFRKMLQEFDFNQKSIQCLDKYEEGVNFIELSQPNVVICDNNLDDKNGFDVLRKHLEFQPKRHNTVFVIILSENSPAVLTRASNEEVDGIIVKPFTYKSLQNIFLNASSRLFDNSEYSNTIEDGKAEILQGNYEQAIKTLTSAEKLNKLPVLAHFYKGKAFEAMKKHDDALSSYAKGLKLSPKNYRCLNHIFQLNLSLNRAEDAYQNALQLLEEHPLDPQQIPLLIRLSIQNKQYEDITRYSKLFANLEEQDKDISTHIAAGLVILGKYLFEHDKPDVAFETYQKALFYSRGKLSVIKEVFSSLLHMGRVKEAKSVIVNHRDLLQDTDTLKLMEYEMTSKFGSPLESLNSGEELLKIGIKDPMIFRACLKSCVELQKGENFVENLLSQGVEAYPHLKNEFYSIVSPILGQE